MKLSSLIAAAFALAGAGLAQAASVEAISNATVQPAGVRTGGNGINFFNIEGSSFGNFASYGVARFNVAGLKAGFDASYGAGGWAVDSIALVLTQSNAAFTANGLVDVFFTDDDTVSLTSPSPLKYGFAGDFADAQQVMQYSFTKVASGTVETHALFTRGAANSTGAQALAADLFSDNLVTLALVDGNATVAATYAGYNNNTYAGPTLAINVVAVPEPETYALLLAGLGLLGVAARRR